MSFTTRQQALGLHEWYAAHLEDRKLPWRRPKEPMKRVCLVEGLLAQTRANQVSRRYDEVFDGVSSAREWMDLEQSERYRRVSLLGLGHLKLGAVDGIARVIGNPGKYSHPGALYADLILEKGIGPYTAGMIALMHSQQAVPVDTNVERVGSRADPDGDATRWMADLMEEAPDFDSKTGWPASYEVACAVLDVGNSYCKPRERWCDQCPLGEMCATADACGQQGLALTEPKRHEVYVVATLDFRGLHHWASIPEDEPRQYLGNRHRHKFHVEVGVAVPHHDRAVEILHLRDVAEESLKDQFDTCEGSDEIDFAHYSCEMLADLILKKVTKEFGKPAWCRVMEDGENGAETRWSK